MAGIALSISDDENPKSIPDAMAATKS